MKGRQKKRSEDNISELRLGEALRKAGDREEWRKMVARSSLMPQRSFRLRDEHERKGQDNTKPGLQAENKTSSP